MCTISVEVNEKMLRSNGGATDIIRLSALCQDVNLNWHAGLATTWPIQTNGTLHTALMVIPSQ